MSIRENAYVCIYNKTKLFNFMYKYCIPKSRRACKTSKTDTGYWVFDDGGGEKFLHRRLAMSSIVIRCASGYSIQ